MHMSAPSLLIDGVYQLYDSQSPNVSILPMYFYAQISYFVVAAKIGL